MEARASASSVDGAAYEGRGQQGNRAACPATPNNQGGRTCRGNPRAHRCVGPENRNSQCQTSGVTKTARDAPGSTLRVHGKLTRHRSSAQPPTLSSRLVDPRRPLPSLCVTDACTCGKARPARATIGYPTHGQTVTYPVLGLFS